MSTSSPLHPGEGQGWGPPGQRVLLLGRMRPCKTLAVTHAVHHLQRLGRKKQKKRKR